MSRAKPGLFRKVPLLLNLPGLAGPQPLWSDLRGCWAGRGAMRGLLAAQAASWRDCRHGYGALHKERTASGGRDFPRHAAAGRLGRLPMRAFRWKQMPVRMMPGQ